MPLNADLSPLNAEIVPELKPVAQHIFPASRS